MPGECNTNGVVYHATVTTSNGDNETYIGFANFFKKRYSKHKATLLAKPTDGKTSLSTHFWKENDLGNDPVVSWMYIETNIPTFNTVTRQCKLFLKEFCYIVLRQRLATLNSRQEIVSQCRHMESKLLGGPPG